jgi:hypothetical protein
MIAAIAILSIAAAIVLGMTIKRQITAAYRDGYRSGFFKGYEKATTFQKQLDQ